MREGNVKALAAAATLHPSFPYDLPAAGTLFGVRRGEASALFFACDVDRERLLAVAAPVHH